MRVTMDVKVNGNGYYTDADYYPRRTVQRISVASRPFSPKIVVHRTHGNYDDDRSTTKTVLPDFGAFLMEFTEFDDVRAANWTDEVNP